MIFTGKTNLTCNPMLDSDSSMQQNNSLADQLLMATNNCEVEETLSRLMMLASMSPGPSQSITGSNNNSTVPPPGLVGSASNIVSCSNQSPGGTLNQQQQQQQHQQSSQQHQKQQQIENFVEF